MDTTTTPSTPSTTTTRKPRKRRAAKAAERAKRTSVLAAHQQELVQQIIGPRLLTIIAEYPDIGLNGLAAAYNSAYGTKFSPGTVKGWTDILGWKHERITRWLIPPSLLTTATPAGPWPPAASNQEEADAPAGPVNVASDRPAPGGEVSVLKAAAKAEGSPAAMTSGAFGAVGPGR